MDDTKKRLGRGLSALLGADMEPPTAAERELRRVPIEAVVPNPLNPRSLVAEEELDELTESIRKHGVMSPILVRQAVDGYEIIAGERRWRAAQRAGLHQVPVIVRKCTDSEALEIAIIENVQRVDLNPIDEAAGYQRLIREFGHSQEALGKLVGKSRPHIANTLRLLNLPKSLQACVRSGDLTAGHARALLGAPDPEALADTVVRNNLSVRETEALVARLTKERPEREPKDTPVDDADTRALVRRLSDALGLKVDLRHNRDESGALTIRYTTVDQLDDVIRRLGA